MLTPSQSLTVDDLLASGATPAWFGLGFIQMKLTEDTRIHFWHPEMMADTPEEELHDHRYRFESVVLRGTLVHETYEFVLDDLGDHEMVEVSCEPGNEADPVIVGRGAVRPAGTYHMVAGSSYVFPETGFHRIQATKAVTFLTRGPKVRDVARVLKPIGGKTVCPFARQIPEAQLWEAIADLMGEEGRPGYHLKAIEKGVLGEPSKIREEVEEFMDAIGQQASVMALVELCDLQGAVEAYLRKHHPSISLKDLETMSRITGRAFANGRR